MQGNRNLKDMAYAMPQDLGSRAEILPVRRASRAYSRFVALMKLVLPATAATLVLLIVVWPRLAPGFSRLRHAVSALDLREARDLRMVNARYSGIDRQNRPFVITADTARQMPNQDDLVSLESPKADMTLQNGSWIMVSAFTGVYLSQTQSLNLFGTVKLIGDRGFEFTTDSAHVDMNGGAADGHEPVEGQGVFGHISAQGFRVVDHGDTIIFTGKSKLHLNARDGAASAS
jgi:lipopolysaccharide export system protein LptC